VESETTEKREPIKIKMKTLLTKIQRESCEREEVKPQKLTVSNTQDENSHSPEGPRRLSARENGVLFYISDSDIDATEKSSQAESSTDSESDANTLMDSDFDFKDDDDDDDDDDDASCQKAIEAALETVDTSFKAVENKSSAKHGEDQCEHLSDNEEDTIEGGDALSVRVTAELQEQKLASGLFKSHLDLSESESDSDEKETSVTQIPMTSTESKRTNLTESSTAADFCDLLLATNKIMEESETETYIENNTEMLVCSDLAQVEMYHSEEVACVDTETEEAVMFLATEEAIEGSVLVEDQQIMCQVSAGVQRNLTNTVISYNFFLD